jgi:hypothetical protein
MTDRKLVMLVTLLQERQVPLIPVLALPFFDLVFHGREVRAEQHALAVAEPDVVVGVAFEQLHAFSFEACAEFFEGQVEEAGQEEEGRALVEAVAFVVDQAAAAAGEGVLFEDGDFEAGFGEAGGGADAAYSGAYNVDGEVS